MPFIDQEGNLLTSIELGQVPVMAPTFQLRERIGYYPVGRESEVTWAPAHVPDDHPDSENRTDLASVPAIFWSLIASYGRQTAPAVLHDSECARVLSGQRSGVYTAVSALAERERIDRRFRLGLRELGVAPFRAWVMWTFVSFERYLRHSAPRFVGLMALAIVGLLLVVASPVALLLGAPWLAAAMLVTPLGTSLLAGDQWKLLVWGSFAGALLLPVAALQVAAYLPWAAIENVVWFFVDWLPHRKGSPVVGPVDVRNIRRI
ncbi:hypothetical protein BH09ACT5_BH09ACT5_09790 [soil metagenome]